MLERVSARLQQSHRPYPSAFQRSLRPRRMLHSMFWHHGAVDLSLPPWWMSFFPTAQAETSLGRVDNHTNEEFTRASITGLLEFLYPDKTRTLLKRMSDYALGSRKARKRRENLSLRRYSSQSRAYQARASLGPASVAAEHTTSELHPVILLGNIIHHNHAESYDRVWQLFHQVDPSERSSSLVNDLLEHFSASSRAVDADRSISLFESLPDSDRRPSSYRSAIAAFLTLQKLELAADAYEDALRVAPAAAIGLNLLLVKYLRTKQWGLAVHVYQLHLRKVIAPNKDDAGIERFLKDVSELQDPFAILLKMARAGYALFKSSSSDFAIYRDFILAFSRHAARKATKADAHKIRCVLRLMEKMELPISELYGQILNNITEEEDLGTRYDFDPTASLSLYRDWRSLPDFRPSPDIHHRILKSVCYLQVTDGSDVNMSSVAADIRRIHGRLLNKAIRLLMYTFARLGKTNEVHDYFAEFLEHNDHTELHPGVLRPLIYVHARRSEMDKAVEQFERMRTTYGVTPDIVCHNILLHGYARAGDYENCLRYFENMRKSGVQPDSWSFGAVMNACGHRGDVEMAQQFLRLASFQGVVFNTAMLCGLVEAQIGNDNVADAVAIAEQALKVKQQTPGRLDGFLTPLWNHVLTAYAFRTNIGAILALSRKMQENDIALDGKSYAAIMLCLVKIRQTNAAEKIMRKVMRKHNVRINSFHYAILMAGYVRQQEYARVFKLDDEMKERNLRETISTRLPLLRAKALTELDELKRRGIDRPDVRLFKAEADLRELVYKADSLDVAEEDPRQGIERMPIAQANPGALFSYIISIYGKRKSLAFVREMLKMYTETKGRSTKGEDALPLRLLTSLMITYRHAKEWSKLDKCWNLAQNQANLVKLWESPFQSAPNDPSAVNGPSNNNRTAGESLSEKERNTGSSSEPQNSTLSDVPERSKDDKVGSAPTVPTGAQSTRVSPSFAAILSTALIIYLRALADQRRYHLMISTVDSLLASGYTLDSRAWNTYVEVLARSGQAFEAFRVCESRLMSSWPGWNDNEFPYYRKRGQRPLRHPPQNLNVPWGLTVPYYRTMVFLSRALVEAKERESLGGGRAGPRDISKLRRNSTKSDKKRQEKGEVVNSDEQRERTAVKVEEIFKVAPLTVKAVETMPQYEDEIQDAYLRQL